VNETDRQASRIVIALDTSEPADYVLEIAQRVYVAAGHATELVGLFIEDARLLRYTESRLTREIVLSGGVRPLERRTLERQIRAQAERVRRHFEAAAAKRGLRHAFRIARGEIIAEWIRGAAEAEALIVASAARPGAPGPDVIERLAEAPLPAVLFARPGWSTGRNVVALIAEPDQVARVVGTAAHVAAQSRSPLRVILTGAARDAQPQIADEIAALLQGLGAPAPEPPPMLRDGARAVAQSADVADARLIVLAAGQPLSAELLRALLPATRAALLLLRGN
jgi:hypothetical protein